MTNMIWTTVKRWKFTVCPIQEKRQLMLQAEFRSLLWTKDIDIMILVDLDEQNIKDYDAKLSDITFDINLDNDLMIMPIVKNENHFRKWIEAYPFYRNIEKEGVKLYAA